MIKKSDAKDLDLIVGLHLKSLKEGLFYALGEDVLRVVYAEIMNDNDSFVLSYYIGKELVGVAASTKNVDKVFAKLKQKYFFKIGLSVLRISFRRPLRPFQLLCTKYSSNIKSELLFLFVDDKFRGSGIGEELVSATTEEFRMKGIKEYRISILTSNARARKFYERIGFLNINQTTILGEIRNEYMKII